MTQLIDYDDLILDIDIKIKKDVCKWENRKKSLSHYMIRIVIKIRTKQE